MKTARFIAILALSAATALAVAPAPDWQPSPDMVGTFHSVAGKNVLVVSPDAGIKFDGGKDFAGTVHPDPSGPPGRYLAQACRIQEHPAEDREPETVFFVLSFEASTAVWQLLGMGKNPDEIEWLEDRYVEKREGIVRYEKKWFEHCFVSDRPFPAGAPEITPEAARQRLVGGWENFVGEFGGVGVILAPNGYGIFGASVMSMPCSWRISKTDDGWLLACKIYEGSSFPGKSDISFALLKADPRLQRLRLLAVDRTLEAATAAAEALDPDAPPAYLYHSCDTVPPELAERLAATISSLQPNPSNPKP